MKNFFELTGKVITKIDLGTEYVTITLSDGKRCRLSHFQDCCESVQFVGNIGDVNSILGKVIQEANDFTTDSLPSVFKKSPGGWGSYTIQCFYVVVEDGSRFEMWSLGESNGYYGETMDFHDLSY